MPPARDVHLAGWAGIISVTFIPVPFFITGRFPHFAPYLGEPADRVLAFVADNAISMQTQIVLALSIPLYLWFSAGLVELLKVPGQSEVPTRLIGWSTTAAVAVSVISYSLWAIPTLHLVHEPAQAETTLAFIDAALVVYIFTYPFLALLLFGSGLAIRRTTVLPRWLGTSALVLSVLNAAAAFTIVLTDGPLQPGTLAGLVPMTLFCLWVLPVGVAMARWRPHPSLAAPTRPVAAGNWREPG